MFRKRKAVPVHRIQRPSSPSQIALTSETSLDTSTTVIRPKDCHPYVKRRRTHATANASGLVSKTKVDAEVAQENLNEIIVPGDSVFQSFKSDLSLDFANDQRATAVFDIETDRSHDHRSTLERNEAIGKAILEGKLDEGVYRGLGASRPISNRREGAIAAGKYSGNYGPVRGSQHMRMTMRVDFNPEICKDYKETGYCGFGDTCKFLHDRTDYKGGWQLEMEWKKEQKAKQDRLNRVAKGEALGSNDESALNASDEDSENESSPYPSHCYICQQPWTESLSPVVTLCSHYFCENCAYKQYGKSSKCAQCGTNTEGTFHTAHALLKNIQNQQSNHTKCTPKEHAEVE